jgi:hypothetical protein
MAGNWIAGATENKGGLHRSLGVPQGQKIPRSMIEQAAKKGGRVGAQARLAMTLEGLRPKKQSSGRDSSAIAKAAAGKSGY